MPAVRKDITIYAGSYEPIYWLITNPATGNPIDLTTAGYLVAGVVSMRSDGNGTTLLTLTDADFRRTTTGRVYYEPLSSTSAAWVFSCGHYQFKLINPVAGKDFRFGEGRFMVEPEL